MLGNLFRYLDFETLLQPHAEGLLQLFNFLGKDSSSQLGRELFLHHCSLIVKRCGQEFPQFFQVVFQACFHQMQSDVKANESILTSLASMVQAQLRHDFGNILESKRGAIAVNEFLDHFLLRGSDDDRAAPHVSSALMV